MTARARSSLIFLFSSLSFAAALSWPRPGQAAPPDSPPAFESSEDETGLTRNPDSKLNFLSDQEYQRLARSEPVSVPTQVVLSSDFPNRLANSCQTLDSRDARAWAVGGQVDLATVLSTDGESDLFDRLQRLSASSSKQEILDAARQLAGIGAALGKLCDRVAGYEGGVTTDDVELLRSVFEDEAVNLARLVEVLDKSGEQLLDVLTAPDADFEAAKQAFVEAVDLGQPGTPQSIGALSSLGSGAKTAFQGLAEFLINRAREEAIAFVRDELTQAICDADPGLFIPKTCKVLRTTDAGMSLSAMGASLNTALQTDLEWMADRLLVLAGERAPQAAYPATNLRVLLALSRHTRAHGNPVDFLVSLHQANEIDCEQGTPAAGSGDAACADTMALLRMASTLSYSIVSQQRDLSDHYKSLGVAFAVERHAAEMPASARARLQRMVPEAGWTADGQLRFSPEHLRRIHRIIVDSVVIVQSLQDRIDDLSALGRDPSDEEMLATAAVAAVALANIGLDIMDLVEAGRGRPAAVATHELAPAGAVLASPTPRALAAAPPEAAGDPLPQTLTILRPLLEDASDGFTLASGLSDPDRSKALGNLFELVVYLLERHAGDSGEGKASALERDLDHLRRYLPMFIEIANAQSSAEVAAALESAFPAGGYKLKYRQGAVSLNAFLGAYGGGLYGSAIDNSGNTISGLVNGEFTLYAPIGVHLTAPVGRYRKRPWHLGGMIAVIDVGGLMTSKWVVEDELTLDTSSGGTQTIAVGEPSNFNFAGLVAPGGYFTVGVSKSPFVFGLGASYSPFAQQRTVTTYDSNGDQTDSSQSYLGALRFGAFVAVDITMVGFGIGGRK